MAKKCTAVILTLALATVLVACSPKTSLTAQEFSDRLEQAGYAVTVDEAMTDPSYSMSATAVDPDGRFTIEFYTLDSSESARHAFDLVRNDIRARTGTWYSRVETNASNFNVYRGTNDGAYFFISRVDSTFVYVETASGNRDAVNEAMRLLGYY